MKMKLTILAFGLLLAVGWTNSASAQLLRGVEPETAMQEHPMASKMKMSSSSTVSKVPRRGHTDVAANEQMFTKADYDAISYNWYPNTTGSGTATPASLTDVVTDPYQMYWLLRSTYMNSAIPGIRWNDVYESATTYFGIGRGWDIGEISNPTYLYIYTSDEYACFKDIKIVDANGTTKWTWSLNSSAVAYSATPSTRTIGGTTFYYFNDSDGGAMRINVSSAVGSTAVEGLRVVLTGRGYRDASSETYSDIQVSNESYFTWNYLANGETYDYEFFIEKRSTITPPSINAYTIFLIKVKDFSEKMTTEKTKTYKASDLIDLFTDCFESIELLTDGLRVGENTDQAGTVFAYTGVLNRFYFIGKGKTTTNAADGSSSFDPYATGPFYVMYEEFSPTTTAAGAQTQDFYTNMHGGKYYEVKHDCQSVLGLEHFFSMFGRDTTAYRSVSPMVLYIPDLRSEKGKRDYEAAHRPQVGLYTIKLTAETEPVADYSDPDNRNYIVYLDWTSSLNQMVNNTVDQTYIIYTVTYDANNKPIYTPLDTVYNVTTYDYIVPQQQTSQQIEYVIMGYPTNATNNPEVQEGGIFFTYSDPDDVQIPGWFDFMILYRERYESDFVIKEEKNYYRNYLYPTNLAPGTGMTMEQLKKEWPNQTASYTLWRDNLGIAKLEVRAIGDKVYYRIRYYEDTQVTTGPNAIGVDDDKKSGNAKMPYNYVEIPNE